MKIVKIENTLFFQSEKHFINLGYLVAQFRKREIVSLSAIRACWKRARALENHLENQGNYVSLLWKAKQAVYRKRYDSERALENIIHPILETGLNTSLVNAWSIVMEGFGTSAVTGKRIKKITNLEKRVKVAKQFIDLLAQ